MAGSGDRVPARHKTHSGVDEGPRGDDDSIDEEGLFDGVLENVADEHDAHIGCEEAPMRLPSNPSDPTPTER